MYFNNRATALENENTLQKAVAKARTFDEHQVATAMFLTTMVNNYNSDSRGWTQNCLIGYMCPNDRRDTVQLRAIIDAVERTLQGFGPQTACGDAIILMDEELAEDQRFVGIPVGAAVLFRGVLHIDRWDIRSELAKRLTVPGYFLNKHEFVVVDPVYAGSYLQGTTRWHGGMNEVGHLQLAREPLKLMNRPLSETHALAEIYHEHPDKPAHLWLKPGMRFDLRPAGSSLSRILTPPEDTQPHRTVVPRVGSTALLKEILAPALGLLDTAWAMTDLPHTVLNDAAYPGGHPKAATVFTQALAHLPEVCIPASSPNGGDFNSLARMMLTTRGCQLRSDHRLVGRDGQIFDLDGLVRKYSYIFGRVDTANENASYGQKSLLRHQCLLMFVAAFVHKYDLPREALYGLMLALCAAPAVQSNQVGAVRCAMLCKSRPLLNKDVPIMDVLAALRDEPGEDNRKLYRLVAEVFAESRVARSRATYHDDLNTAKRKKLLAKFYPTV
jgi:hypothetical protein